MIRRKIMQVKERIEALRQEMKKRGISFYVVPSADYHQSEYVSDFFKSRAYMSGFTGSAGTVVIGLEEAGLWTDGRYFIQAEKELQGSGVTLFKMGQENVPEMLDWIVQNAKEKDKIGMDGKVISAAQKKEYEKKLGAKSLLLDTTEDLVGMIWQDRPQMPCEMVMDHDVKYAGKTRQEKAEEVRAKMKEKGADYYVLSSLDDIAWLFNIRGGDVQDTPVSLGYAFLTDSEQILYMDEKKINKAVKEALLKDHIALKPYEAIEEKLSSLEKGSIYFSPARLSAWLYDAISEQVTKIEGLDITTSLKACKNETEIAQHEHAQVRDGVAMLKFMHWLKTTIGKEKITEVSAAEKLLSFRAQGDLFMGPSFGTISAYGENAAMMHYHPNEENPVPVEAKGFLLVDSGGQYLDGTTDITRTFVMGPLTEEEKKDYTLTLRGHINLAMAKFLKGTTGLQLDILARRPLWEEGIDYKCGTGHGVGYFLNVHEGPQSISPRYIQAKIEEGMFTTDEPGVYKEGKHGIRIENTLCAEKDVATESGQFMKFRTISYCPIDLEAVDGSLMDQREIKWLNDYHQMVFEKLSPHVDENLKAYLKTVTKAI